MTKTPKNVVVVLCPDGTRLAGVNGCPGPGCEAVTRPYTDQFEGVADVERTPEFFQTPLTHDTQQNAELGGPEAAQ